MGHCRSAHPSVRADPRPTPGRICYQIDQNSFPICFVGDTLFAGSINRSNPAGLYQTHLQSVRERVLTLAPDTVLFQDMDQPRR